MTPRRKNSLIAAIAGAVALAGATTIALADKGPGDGGREGWRHGDGQHWQRPGLWGLSIDDRIALLRGQLKITDAEVAQWDKVADAMRENGKQMEDAMEQMRANRDKPESAVDRLQARAQMAALFLQSQQRFLDAFKPLYDSLSPDQKQAADDALMPHHHWHG